MGWGFSIYGNAAISLLYGRFSVNQKETADYTLTIDETDVIVGTSQILKFQDSYSLGQAVTDLALGLMWEHNFKDVWRLALNCGWEQHLFFTRNGYWRVTRPGGGDGFANDFSHERGDLSFQGVTLGGRIDF